MKIRCIDKNIDTLTFNKEYEVVRDNSFWWFITDDEGELNGYNKKLFEEVNGMNIIEAMEMPVGTEFEVIIDNKKYNMNAKINKSKQQPNEKQLLWDNRAYIEVTVTDSLLNAKFIPIQKPVSFMEALNSKNKIKVDHYLTRGIYEFNNYMNFNIMCRYLYNFENSEVIKIINEGKWYIED